MSFTKAMQYEEMALTKPSRKSVGKEVEKNINQMTTGSIVWFLVIKHKFAVLATFTITYVVFSLFGTLLVGLIESLK